MAMNAQEYVAGLVEKGRKAQAIANNFTQEDVDLITAAVTTTSLSRKRLRCMQKCWLKNPAWV